MLQLLGSKPSTVPETVASVRLVAPGSSRVAMLAPVVYLFSWGLGKMTASLAAAASLALSIMVVSFTQTPLARFSKPVSDQRKSLLGFETLAVGTRMTQ